jgi:glycosyltransferase involved in cell wall biosynthesis
VRIAFIGQRGVPATFGGIEHHVEQLGSRLAGRGHDVTVYCRTNYVAERPQTYRGMRLVHLPTVSSKRLDAIVHSALSTAASIGRGFDVIHYHAIGPGALSPVARVGTRAKVVQTIHGRDDERAKWGRGAQALLRGTGWLSAHVPHATIVVSRALAEHYRARYGRTAVYIPNGVDVPASDAAAGAAEIERRFGLRAGGYLLFVGRMVPEKQPDMLVRAFRQVPDDLKLVLVGGSSFTDGYVHSVRKLVDGDSRVVWADYVYGPVLAELYANARAFVLPSTVEGLPLTLLEAASHGTPVVASAIPPHIEVLGQEEPGRRLFPPGDEQGLVSAIGRSLADQAGERAGAARLADEVAKTYRWDDAVDATEAVYERIRARR